MVDAEIFFQPYTPIGNASFNYEQLFHVIHTVRHILETGIRPVQNERDAVSHTKPNSILFERYLRRYYGEETYDVSTLFHNPLSKAKAEASKYGSLYHVIIRDLSLEDAMGLSSDEQLDVLIESKLLHAYLSLEAGKHLYETYWGEQSFDFDKLAYYVPLTTYFVVLVAQNKTEFVALSQRLGLRDTRSDNIKIGKQGATNHIVSPFSRVILSVNPIAVLIPDDGDYIFNETIQRLLLFLASLGELYNILSLLTDIHEACIITKQTVLREIRTRMSRLKVNIIRDVVDLYGMKTYNKMEQWFYDIPFDDLAFFLEYGSPSAELIYLKEGEFHCPAISRLLQNITDFFPDGLAIVKCKNGEDFSLKFRDDLFRVFDASMKTFASTVKQFLEDVERVFDASRTTVQLNITIVALIWTMLFSVLALIPFAKVAQLITALFDP